MKLFAEVKDFISLRICSKFSVQQKKSQNSKISENELKTQKYPKIVVDKEIEKALKIPQEQLRRRVQKQTRSRN